MNWEGQFRIPGQPEEVIHFFSDVARMAACMPGASIDSVAEDGSFTGTMTVAFGPKRISFKGKGISRVDVNELSGHLIGQGVADMRAARFKVNVTYRLHADLVAPADGPMTVCVMRSSADLHGVLAEFARTGGPFVAAALMEEFSHRVLVVFGRPSLETEAGGSASADQGALTLSLFALLRNGMWRALRRWWSRTTRLRSRHHS